jgi:DNA-binding protein YbaB
MGAPGMNTPSVSEMDPELRQRRLAELTVEFANARITERAAEEGVTVVIDGAGELIELTIDDAALAGTRPQVIGLGVITALERVRAIAAARRQDRIIEVLTGGNDTSQDDSGGLPQHAARPPTRATRARPSDRDETYYEDEVADLIRGVTR